MGTPQKVGVAQICAPDGRGEVATFDFVPVLSIGTPNKAVLCSYLGQICSLPVCAVLSLGTVRCVSGVQSRSVLGRKGAVNAGWTQMAGTGATSCTDTHIRGCMGGFGWGGGIADTAPMK